jgi:predicted NBD/HSP70 family sugar kinase
VVRPSDSPASNGAQARNGPARPALLRTLNDEVALRLLVERGRLSRSDMVRLMGVSKPTGSQMIARLEQAQMVRPVGLTKGRPGRAPLLYEINPASGFAAALDVTPRHIHAQVADISGQVIGEHLLSQPSRAANAGPANARKALDHALRRAHLRRSDLSSVVVAAPGSYDAGADRIRYARRLAGWSGTDLMKSLKRGLDIPVSIENDVNLAAVAERRVGAAQDIVDFFLFWVDEGIGGALILDDQLRRGSTGGAGEVGFLQPSGAEIVPRPVRGGSGALEKWAGGTDLADLGRSHGLEGKDATTLVSAAVSTTLPSGAEFIDALALRYALGLAEVISVLDPAAIVLAGSVLSAGGELLRTRIGHHLDEFSIATPRLITSCVEGNPVLAGALHTSVDRARDVVFRAT